MADPEAFEAFLPARLTPDDVQAVEDVLGVGDVQTRGEAEESGLEPLDETEELHLEIDDQLLATAKASAWNAGVVVKDEDGKDVPVNPKKFPERAVRVAFHCGPAAAEVFLDGKTFLWDSEVQMSGQKLKLSPDQLGSFFETGFYQRLRAKLRKDWPLSDEKYSKLFQSVDHPEMAIPRAPATGLVEDGGNEKDETRTASGRKIARFSNETVSSSSAEV